MRQRVTGAGSRLAGKLKEGVGRMTGDDSLAGDGIVDQASGVAKNAAGNVAQALGETIHDLNR
ncbi:MAG: CsbD family protein [Candidatus Acidiferrales bacterium]